MADSSNRDATGFLCNMNAFNQEDRAQYGILSRKLLGAGEERCELGNGYAFRLASARISIMEIAQWITFERKCCPFLNLQIEIEPRDGPVWLRITGAPGVKEFILSEIGAR
ncbi:MAG: hypothetical protein ACLQBA_09230 [Candidatus Binataceae bacterium]